MGQAHFGRIIQMASLVPNGSNCIVTSSIDKTVKVWDLDCMQEQVYSLDRHDLPLEEVLLGPDGGPAAARSRNSVVLWDLDTGRIIRKVSNTVLGAVVTQAALTADGKLLVTVECGCLMLWALGAATKHADKGLLVKDPVAGEVVQLVLCGADTKLFVVSKQTVPDGDATVLSVEKRTLPQGEKAWSLEFPVTRVKPICLTPDESWLVGLAWEAQKPVIFVFHADSGEFLLQVPLKMASVKDVTAMVPVRDRHNTIALIEGDKAHMCDLKNRRFLKPIPSWTGQSTKDGRWGLSAPARGGLELLELGEGGGAVARTLIPRGAQGVCTVHAMFTATDEHVVYYTSAERAIQLFRVENGQKLAHYLVQVAEGLARCRSVPAAGGAAVPDDL
jgi:hypothetical protein